MREALYEEGLSKVKNFTVEVEEATPAGLRGAEADAFERAKLHQKFGVELGN